ncbi:hypothetical protein [Leptospira chreensis]|nr:hypothetical protein [Leptospira chreensis]
MQQYVALQIVAESPVHHRSGGGFAPIKGMERVNLKTEKFK